MVVRLAKHIVGQSRADVLEAVEEAIEALSKAPDLDKLLDQARAIRAQLLDAWSTHINDEEHDDWYEQARVARRVRPRSARLGQANVRVLPSGFRRTASWPETRRHQDCLFQPR